MARTRTLGEAVREARGTMSREKFAVLSNTSRSTVQRVEEGSQFPTIDRLAAMAAVGGISLSELLDGVVIPVDAEAVSA